MSIFMDCNDHKMIDTINNMMENIIMKRTFDTFRFISPRLSLEDLVGHPYVDRLYSAQAWLNGQGDEILRGELSHRVDFYPLELQDRLDSLLGHVGKTVVAPLEHSPAGAPTKGFLAAFRRDGAPVGALGFFRMGEDGKLYLITKSEHYHASLGHGVPAYDLLSLAQRAGVTNATHNNTRGFVVRLLERELVALVNSLELGDEVSLDRVIASQEPRVLNRVINLQSGSVAVEAAVKMMLARFYRLEAHFPAPIYEGKTPVFLVIADGQGGGQANYHGTTMVTQTFRGLWPEIAKKIQDQGIFKIRPVRINDTADFKRALEEENQGERRVAGFIHEIVLMNYGGVLLNRDYLQEVYALAHAQDVPICVDEIQSCLWYRGLFLFKEYGLKPDFVSVGKGFSGGYYAASRIITTSAMDSLNQFGALVTNGQEELAALAYLITLRFAQENQELIAQLGEYYQEELRRLAQDYPRIIMKIEGLRHLSSIFFYSAEEAIHFCAILTAEGIDISAQNYKADCPPSALTKLPLTATPPLVELVLQKMRAALDKMGKTT